MVPAPSYVQGLSATASDRRGPFWVSLIMWAWELDREWLERDPDSGERNAPSNEKSGNLSGNFSDPAQNFRSLEKE